MFESLRAMRINPELVPGKCCLHLVDLQVNLMKAVQNADKVIDAVVFLLRAAKVLKIPTIANTQYKKGLGLYVPEIEVLMDDIARPDKTEFNAFDNTETIALIQSLPVQPAVYVLAGVETHICIYQTALGALRQGFIPWIISDAVSSRRIADHEIGLQRLAQLGAIVGSAEMFVYQLFKKAGTAEFKEMMPYILAQKR